MSRLKALFFPLVLIALGACQDQNMPTAPLTASVAESPTVALDLTPAVEGSVFVTTGESHSCSVDSEGTVTCWGRNSSGIGGSGGQTEVPAGLGFVTEITAGSDHTCSLDADDNVVCWGGNVYQEADVPADLGPALHVSAFGRTTCAVRTDETVACWGYTGSGQASPPAGLGSVAQVSTGYYHVCAVEDGGALTCWGSNTWGESTVPADLGPVRQVSAGSSYTCAVGTDELLSCWGVTRGPVPADLGTVASVSVGYRGTCAVTTDATVRCWAPDYVGGALNPPADLGPVQQVRVGEFHACALRTDGAVVCWGWNGWGQSDPHADITAPELSLPPDPLYADATGPDGAIVTFSATATDDFDGTIPVLCTPASGSLFSIGLKQVDCFATDQAGNQTTGSFRVSVRGAVGQLQVLESRIEGLLLGAPEANSLLTKISSALKSLSKDNLGASCAQLDDLLAQIEDFESAGKLTGEEAAGLTADVTRIEAVIGC